MKFYFKIIPICGIKFKMCKGTYNKEEIPFQKKKEKTSCREVVQSKLIKIFRCLLHVCVINLNVDTLNR
jgi:hypothetical protein